MHSGSGPLSVARLCPGCPPPGVPRVVAPGVRPVCRAWYPTWCPAGARMGPSRGRGGRAAEDARGKCHQLRIQLKTCRRHRRPHQAGHRRPRQPGQRRRSARDRRCLRYRIALSRHRSGGLHIPQAQECCIRQARERCIPRAPECCRWSRPSGGRQGGGRCPTPWPCTALRSPSQRRPMTTSSGRAAGPASCPSPMHRRMRRRMRRRDGSFRPSRGSRARRLRRHRRHQHEITPQLPDGQASSPRCSPRLWRAPGHRARSRPGLPSRHAGTSGSSGRCSPPFSDRACNG